MAISTALPISLSDVATELSLTAPYSLNSCFGESSDAAFHATYKGSKDRLTNFRGYDQTLADPAFGLTSSHSQEEYAIMDAKIVNGSNVHIKNLFNQVTNNNTVTSVSSNIELDRAQDFKLRILLSESSFGNFEFDAFTIGISTPASVFDTNYEWSFTSSTIGYFDSGSYDSQLSYSETYTVRNDPRYLQVYFNNIANVGGSQNVVITIDFDMKPL